MYLRIEMFEVLPIACFREIIQRILKSVDLIKFPEEEMSIKLSDTK